MDRGLQRARLDGRSLWPGRLVRLAAAGSEREQGGSSQQSQAHNHSIRDVRENAEIINRCSIQETPPGPLNACLANPGA